MKTWRKWLSFPILIFGVAVFIYSLISSPELPRDPDVSNAKYVDVFSLKKIDIAPRVEGFGRLKPKDRWQAISEVEGTVLEINPDLEKGQLLTAGTVLLRIDPTEIAMREAKAVAEKNAAVARLEQLVLDEKNIDVSLKIEKRRLALIEQEFNRKKNLRSRGMSTQSEFDTQEQALLAQNLVVQELNYRQTLLPTEKIIREAEVENTTLALQELQLDKEKTVIRLPFDARISRVEVAKGEYVRSQQLLLIATGLAHFELETQLAMHDFQLLAQSTREDGKSLSSLPVAISNLTGQEFPSQSVKVSRVSDGISDDLGTVGVFLDIRLMAHEQQTDIPYLFSDMLVKAEIEGIQSSHFVVPEKAVRGQKLYINQNGKLRIVPIEILFRVGDLVAVEGDLQEGDLVVLHDILPALEGMALEYSEEKIPLFQYPSVMLLNKAQEGDVL